MSELGLVYVQEVPMVKVKLVAKEINIKGAPMQIVIQYWTKDGKLVASGEVNKFDEPKMNNVASHNSSASVQGKKAIDCAVRHISALFHQCAEHREADFGEVCSQCQYMPECNCDFLNTLEPLLRHTTEDFILAVKKEPNDR